MTITQIADGMFSVEHDGRNDIVYVAGPLADRWTFWNGQVFRGDFRAGEAQRAGPHKVWPSSLTAPMPARVSRILIQPGSAVKKGDTLVVLEAMKMELPVRAPADAVVTAVTAARASSSRRTTLLSSALGPP